MSVRTLCKGAVTDGEGDTGAGLPRNACDVHATDFASYGRAHGGHGSWCLLVVTHINLLA